MKRFLPFAILAFLQISASAVGQTTSNQGIPAGEKLRCGTIGFAIVGGVAQPVCKFIAEKLSVSVEAVTYKNPRAYAESFGKGEWDVAIGPTVLAPAAKADVTSDLWLIPLIYVAAPGHEFAAASQVDRKGITIGTIQGSPADKFLSHALKSAELIRIAVSTHMSTDVAELLKSGKAEVFGADSVLIHQVAQALAGAKIVSGEFNAVRIAAAVPKDRSALARDMLAEIVAEAKRAGVIQKAIEQQGLKGLRVAD
jgi:polar amino acid transport system substrate-binding protein